MRTSNVSPNSPHMLPFLLLLLFCLAASAADAKCAFPAIFNFGDSNSDTGGFWAAFPAQTGPFGMTYFKAPTGRASDGRLVIDFLAAALGLPFLSPYLKSIGSDFRYGANFATLASTVRLPTTSLFVTGISPFSLGIQLNQMKDLRTQSIRAAASKTNGVAEHLPPSSVFSQALYTFDIGQNDFTSELASLGIAGVKQFLPQVASQIAWSIKEIYETVGGRTFLIFNLAPIGCFPAFLTELPHNSSDLDLHGCLTPYNAAVAEYNALLNATLHSVRSSMPAATVVYVDTHSVKLELFRNPAGHGLLHGTRACCGSGGGDYNFDPRAVCGNSRVIDGRTVSAAACGDPEKYVSWDGIHATEAANKRVAWAVLGGAYFYPRFNLSQLCDLQPID